MPERKKNHKRPPPDYDGSTELPNPQHELIAFYSATGLNARQISEAKGVTLKYASIRLAIQNSTIPVRRDWFLREREKKAMLSVEQVDIMLCNKLRDVGQARVTDYYHLTPEGYSSIEVTQDSPFPHAIKKVKTRTEVTGEGENASEFSVTEFELHDFVKLADQYYRRFGHYPPAKVELGADDELSELMKRVRNKDFDEVPG